MKNLFFISSLILLMASCGKGSSSLDYSVNDSTTSPVDPSEQVSFSQIKSEILTPHCISCHSNVSTESGLSQWITPGDPNSSPFFTTVEDGSMPKNQSPLDTKSLELIRVYITNMNTGGTTGGTSGGTSGGGTSTPSGITYEEIKAKVLTPYRCLNCHSVGTEAKLARWINTSNPASSSLYTTIKSGSMPQGGPRAGTDIQNLVLQYVKDFANR